MIFDINTIKTAYKSLVGFVNRHTNIQLSDVITTSQTGVIINDNNIPYLNLEMIKDNVIDYNNLFFNVWNAGTTYVINNRIKYVYPAYDNSKKYAQGECTTYNNIGYISLIPDNIGTVPGTDFSVWNQKENVFSIFSAVDTNNNKQPDTNPLFWTEVSLFSEILEDRLDCATANVINSCFTADNAVLETSQFFYGSFSTVETIDSTADNITGYCITPKKRDNIKIAINKIALQFSEPVPGLILYFYKNNTQLATQTVDIATNELTWFSVQNFVISDLNANYYIYYRQNDLGTAKAVNINGTLTGSQYMKYVPFKTTDVLDKKTIDSNSYDSIPYIANIDYSIYPDITNFLLNNKNIFAEAIKLHFALDLYKLYLTNENKRINGNRSVIDKDYLLLQTTENTKENSTLISKYNKELLNIRNSVAKAKIDCVVFPKNNRLFNTYSAL